MGAAEVISFDEVRARNHWTMLRQRLHERFDRWLDTLQGRLSEPQPTLSEVTQAVWDLRQSLTGSVADSNSRKGLKPRQQFPEGKCSQGSSIV